jgi:alkylation response protein AidB-like acyl-CoA dehydrogenase
MSTKTKGGEFLIKETNPQDIFIPEQWTEEQLMMKQTCDDFIDQEILPIIDRIDAQEEGLMPSLLEKAGALGLLGVSVPENLGVQAIPLQLLYQHIRELERCLFYIMETKNKKRNIFPS